MLAAGWLAFGTVRHHDRPTARGCVDRSPLCCHGEPRSPVAYEPARLELVHQPLRLVMKSPHRSRWDRSPGSREPSSPRPCSTRVAVRGAAGPL